MTLHTDGQAQGYSPPSVPYESPDFGTQDHHWFWHLNISADALFLLTENAQIHEMNLEQRGIDRPTDVLSFPMIEYEEPGDFSVIDEESAEAFNPESGELMLGDIVISKEKVLSQAEEYGHLPKREYAFLIAHSMLHLFGYDHMVDEERVVMEAKQKEIMEKVGIFR